MHEQAMKASQIQELMQTVRVVNTSSDTDRSGNITVDPPKHPRLHTIFIIVDIPQHNHNLARGHSPAPQRIRTMLVHNSKLPRLSFDDSVFGSITAAMGDYLDYTALTHWNLLPQEHHNVVAQRHGVVAGPRLPVEGTRANDITWGNVHTDAPTTGL